MRKLLVLSGLAAVTLAQPLSAQGELKPVSAKPSEKSQAYYFYTVGHLYADLAAQAGFRGENVEKAIDNLKQALKMDPSATIAAEELADVYLQSGRVNEAVLEMESVLKQNSKDLNARRILGRMYTRLLSDQRSNRIDKNFLKKALEQFQKIVELAPDDTESWLMLGRLQKVDDNNAEAEAAYRKALELAPDNEDAMTGLAMVYADQGDTRRAAETLERVIAKNPSMRALMALASAYEQLRDYENAANILSRAFEASGGNPEILRMLAQNQIMSRQYDAAIGSLQQLVGAEPNDFSSWLRLSELYRQKGDLVKAREAQSKAQAADANSPEVRFNEVGLLESEGKLNEAIALLEKLLQSVNARGSSNGQDRNFRVALLERLGGLQADNHQIQQAIATFREAAQVDPNSAPRMIARIVEVHREAKDFKAALNEASEAKKVYPDNPLISRLLSAVLADLGRFPEAVQELRSSLRKQPEDREVYLAMAQVHEKSKDFAAVGQALDEAEKLSEGPDKISVLFLRAAALERQKKFDDSEKVFRRVLELDPLNSSALNYLGYMLADRNVRLPEAQELITKALEIDPNNGAYLDSLGWVYYRQQKYEQAELALTQALQRYPKDPTIYDHLGDVYYATGRIKDAIQQWELALKEWASSAAGDKDQDLAAKIEKKLETAKVKLTQTPKVTPRP